MAMSHPEEGLNLTQPCSQNSYNANGGGGGEYMYNMVDCDNTLPPHGMSLEGDGVEEEEDCWGLLRRKGVDQECRLLHRVVNGRRDMYCIGRNDSCDITVPDMKVSSVHCLIYCAYSDEDMLTMYVEDCSANGTYVNSSLIRLKHGERTILKSGDEIYLMNPRYVKSPDLVSYVFINMRERMFAHKKVDDAASCTAAGSSTTNGQSSQLSRPLSNYGSRIEDLYVIGEPIGSGMCGQVHVCTHKATKTQWAVKIIDTKKFGKSPGLSVGELRQEAELMRVLYHPNIIRIEDTFETNSKIFIIMELVSGGDLFDRIIDRGKYPEPRARFVMRMLLDAVKYLHDHNIVHRDLKPENILLVDEGTNSQVKLTDFGLAKKASREGLKTFCGTPQYFAPEVLDRKEGTGAPGTTAGGVSAATARYGFKADMWSLGVVLYIMLSGSFPFDEDHLYDQLREAKYSVSGVEWRSISSHAKHFVRSLMTLNPADRLDVTQALDHPWMKMENPPVVTTSRQHVQNRTDPKSSLQPSDQKQGVVKPSLGVSDATSKVVNSGSGREEIGSDDKAIVRVKTFSPVFWSNRPAFSATVSGSIPRQGSTKNTVPDNNHIQAHPTTVVNQTIDTSAKGNQDSTQRKPTTKSDSPAMHAWYTPVEGCGEGVDDIDDFSSTDDEGGGPGYEREGDHTNANKRKKRRVVKELITDTSSSSSGNKQTTLDNSSLFDKVQGGSNRSSGGVKSVPDGKPSASCRTELVLQQSCPLGQTHNPQLKVDSDVKQKKAPPSGRRKVSLASAKGPPTSGNRRSSKVSGGDGPVSKKVSLRVPMKTLPEMFMLSSAKQNLKDNEKKDKPS